MADAAVGIVANPASGRDIRRLTAKATVFPTIEKANMIQRVLSALGRLGAGPVLMMPDMTGIAAAVQRALGSHRADTGMPWPAVEFIDMPITETVEDTFHAVSHMVARGVKTIVVLGGDGTHRAVAARCGEVPLATLSSGTNNAFPDLREATVAGFAAALVASGRVPDFEATRRNKRLVVRRGEQTEIALVDVCITRHQHVASRAVWQADAMTELFVAFAEPDSIGLSSIAGLLNPVGRDDCCGLHVSFAEGDGAAATPLLAPIAPGLICAVNVAGFRPLEPGVAVPIHGRRGTVALDGEREIEFGPADTIQVSLDLDGPRTIDVARTMRLAAQRGLLHV